MAECMMDRNGDKGVQPFVEYLFGNDLVGSNLLSALY